MHEISVLRDNSLECTIDWLSFTVFSIKNVSSVLHKFGFTMSEFFEAPRGASGYKKMLLANESTIRVLYDGNDDMGIHVDVTGSSIGTFYEHFMETCMEETPFGKALDVDVDVLIKLLELIQSIGQISRLDLAIDDHKPYFTLAQLNKIIVERKYISNWKKHLIIKEGDSSGKITGYTVYLGRRDGDIMLRVYDKQLESDTDSPWVRWELEMKSAYANNAVQKLIHGIRVEGGSIDVTVGSLAVGVLGKYLRIIKLDNSNRSRCSTDRRWKAFLGVFTKIKLYVPRDESSIEQKREWILRQVAPTLSGIVLAEFDKVVATYGDFSVLAKYILAQEGRLKKEFRKQISRSNPKWREDIIRLQEELEQKEKYG